MKPEGVRLEIVDDLFLIYIDESGNESLADKQRPLFILGGCAVLGKDYSISIHEPWRALKSAHFAGADAPLHSSDISTSNTEGINAIGKFFKNNIFHRFAVAVTNNTKIAGPHNQVYLNTAQAAINMLNPFPVSAPFERVAIIVEESTRGDPQARKYLTDLRAHVHTMSGMLEKPIEYYFMSKSLAHPGLEVADFVVHAASGQTERFLKNNVSHRKDFKSVFCSSLPCVHRYVQLKSIKLQEIRERA
jgi:hypothetical protein